MTIAVAWVRTVRDCQELVFVTDSRLSGDGRNFDVCPKVITLPRSDSAIAFAGYTGHGYPMMQQLAIAIGAHAPLRRRSMDYHKMYSHALKVFDSMSGALSSSPLLSGPINADPDVEFLLGGYSWIKKQFEITRIRYRAAEQKFVADPARWVGVVKGRSKTVWSSPKSRLSNPIGMLAFAGDQAKLAEELLFDRLSKKKRTKLDWEPFEVVRDMLRDPKHSETIGGAPQITKVYQYMDATALGVYWPKKANGQVHLSGRPILGYERIDNFVIDPDTFRSSQVIPVGS
jgi:hypothetical protein